MAAPVAAATFAGHLRPLSPAYGETVILLEGPGEFAPVTLARGGKLENRFGAFPHAAFVGMPYGAKVFSKSRNGGFVHMLPFTPELWTHALTHRTQILFCVDIAMVALHLGLRPGSVVVESGTGSGSLTTTLARAVAPHGRVHSFEFNADRARKAAEDFARTGMAHVASVTHRDVCGAGFGAHLDGAADGVFLDLPQPWGALPHARRALRAGGIVCSYSPCVEQVQRTCAELAALGFDDVRTIETLLRPLDVSTLAADVTLPPPHLDVFGAGGGVAAPGAGGAGAGAGGAVPPPAPKRARPTTPDEPLLEGASGGPRVCGAGVGAGAGVAAGGGGGGHAATAGGGSLTDVAAAPGGDERGLRLGGGAGDGPLAMAMAASLAPPAAGDGGGDGGGADGADGRAAAGLHGDAPAAAPGSTPRAAVAGVGVGGGGDGTRDGGSSSSDDGGGPFPPLEPFAAPHPAQRAAVIPAAAMRGHTAYLTFATLWRKGEDRGGGGDGGS